MKSCGDCHTVNGAIEIGSNSSAKKIENVNGYILVMKNTVIEENISTVNGDIEVEAGSVLEGDFSVINWQIKLNGTWVERDLETVNGDVLLGGKSEVTGDIIVRKTRSYDYPTLVISLEEGSTVEGDIRVEDEHRKVEIHKSDNSKIVGRIINAGAREK